MNGIPSTLVRPGLPATAILRLDRGRAPTAVVAPPAPLAVLLPQVLARYGMAEENLPADARACCAPANDLDFYA